MALNIKDAETERLAAEVAELAGETKTAAVRQALRDRRDKLAAGRKRDAEQRQRTLRNFLEDEIWPHVPPEIRGKPPMTKAEREEILGIGPEGW